MNTTTRGVLGAMLLACTAVAPALGQGGLLRRAQQAVTETVAATVIGDASQAPEAGGHSSTGAPAATSSDGRSSGAATAIVLVMDTSVLDRFTRALDAEIRVRDEWSSFEQRFNSCQGQMYTDEGTLEEMNRLTEEMSRQMSIGTTEAMIAASESYQAGMDAVVARKCGTSQTDFVKRQSSINDDALSAATTAGNFTELQYAMLQERVLPFCMAGGRSDRIAGPEGDDFYVYSAEEVAALADRCSILMPAIERVI